MNDNGLCLLRCYFADYEFRGDRGFRMGQWDLLGRSVRVIAFQREDNDLAVTAVPHWRPVVAPTVIRVRCKPPRIFVGALLGARDKPFGEE